MTIIEKIEMYREKNRFVEGLSMVFQGRPKGSSINKIVYEVYQKDVDKDTHFEEWLVIFYDGGDYTARNVSGNSNLANFKVIGDLVYGGDYSEKTTYDCLLERGFERVGL